MKEITLHGSRVLVGESVENIKKHLPQQQVVIITEPNVRKHFGALCSAFPCVEIPGGEAHKTLKTIDFISSQLIDLQVDRKTFLLGVGGGIVCDVTGFVASIFMRGCKFGFVSTTLLSQVDASVGGKNGVNFEGYKNMLGVFAQPQFVICDPKSFATLPQKEFVAGFSEIVKAAMIADASLFDFIEKNAEKALQKNAETLQHLVYESVKIKANIVAIDEREQGERRKLNLGHTFAHAIEKNSTLMHGEAVSVGLCLAAQVSVNLGLMKNEELERVKNILRKLQLPTETNISLPVLFSAMLKDKKKSGDSLHLILPVGIGNCEVREVKLTELENIVSTINGE
ncbi:MAG: 3-dehydroquinate synthase [Prevotellaceae bacterium]|jgi:3-dehydroquinate synthase|nr:3-dehydroquinate synthase [Prevotellaceae bacterium]